SDSLCSFSAAMASRNDRGWASGTGEGAFAGSSRLEGSAFFSSSFGSAGILRTGAARLPGVFAGGFLFGVPFWLPAGLSVLGAVAVAAFFFGAGGLTGLGWAAGLGGCTGSSVGLSGSESGIGISLMNLRKS